MNRLRARHHPRSADEAKWLRRGAMLKSAALFALLGLLLLIASRETSNALDALGPPPGSARSPIEAAMPPASPAATAIPPSIFAAGGATQLHR